MESSEPTLVPQWLRSNGSLTGGGTTTHPLASSSSLRSDDRGASKLARNKSSVNKNDHRLGRTSFPDRTTSSYFRQSSSSNSSGNLRANSSFGRNQHDRDWDKHVYGSHSKDESILVDHRRQDFLDPLENIFPSWVGKEGFRRSQSMISEGRGEIWPRKVVADSSNADKNGNAGSNDLPAKGNTHKGAFGRGFPSLGEKEKLVASDIGRVPSPGLSSAVQSLPGSPSATMGSDKWKSALAEVPAIVGSDGTSVSSGKVAATPTSASVASSKHTGLNMAETVAQSTPRAQTTPQLSAETQRLEELAIKQSRQLIPVTPSVPKALALNSSDKLKTKVGQQQNPISSSMPANYFPRVGPVKPDLSRTSSVGKLHVLKPTWERNGVSSAPKDSLSPTNGSKVANSMLAAAPLLPGSPAVKSPGHSSGYLPTERKPVLPLLEKRPTSQAQSRNDFFNLVRKKSVANSSSVPDAVPSGSPSALNKPNEIEDATSATQQSGDVLLSDNLSQEHTPENKGDGTCNGNSCFGQEGLDNRKSNSSFDLNFFSEEEAAFLRSLGWEENADEDVLTEEEINAFYRDLTKYIDSKPSWKILQGTQPRFSLPLGSIPGISSGLNSSDSKLES